MKKRVNSIDLVKLMMYILKRIWLVIIFAEIFFGVAYYHTAFRMPDTFTASGTMYVNNGNPSLENYQYTNSSDLNTARQLIDTYLIVVKSDKVMETVVRELSKTYPDITSSQVAGSLSMASVSETGVAAVRSRTENPQLSADIVNTVLEVAPEEIIRVVGAGNIEIIDYAAVPAFPDSRNSMRAGKTGAMFGAIIAIGILILLFLLNRRITSASELTENYTPPVLASIERIKKDTEDEEPGSFILTNQSPMEIIENYAKLRMNLLYTLVGKKSKSVVITSSISGEGKSTIASNLAISCAMGGKRVLLIDGDLRRACQRDIFKFDKHIKGLSDALVGNCKWQDAVLHNVRETLDILPAGHFPPNPAELLESDEMAKLLAEIEGTYDLVLIDMPPINVVADPLVLSTSVAGCIFVARQNFSDHRDVRNALISAEMTGMDVLGFVFYGEDIRQGGYYSRRYYKSYYNKYDYRRRPEAASDEENH